MSDHDVAFRAGSPTIFPLSNTNPTGSKARGGGGKGPGSNLNSHTTRYMSAAEVNRAEIELGRPAPNCQHVGLEPKQVHTLAALGLWIAFKDTLLGAENVFWSRMGDNGYIPIADTSDLGIVMGNDPEFKDLFPLAAAALRESPTGWGALVVDMGLVPTIPESEYGGVQADTFLDERLGTWVTYTREFASHPEHGHEIALCQWVCS